MSASSDGGRTRSQRQEGDLKGMKCGDCNALPSPRGAPRMPSTAPSPPEDPPAEREVLKGRRVLPQSGLLHSRLHMKGQLM